MTDDLHRPFDVTPRPEPATLDDAKKQIAELEAELEKAVFESGVLRLQLDMLSSTDTLTGMPNLNGIAQALEKAAARADRSGEPFGLMAIDIPVLERLREEEPAEYEDSVRHAGAMITRGRGTASSKMEALREAGTTVLEFFSDLGMAAKEILWGEGYQT